MYYNKLKVSPEPKVIGVNNGVYQIELDKSCFSNEKEYEKFILEFPGDSSIEVYHPRPLIYKVLKKAKLTDLMGYSERLKGVPFVLSDKAVRAFKDFSLKEYSLLEITLKDNETEKYYLFRYPFVENDKVNFEKSVFYTQRFGHEKVYHKIQNENEFMAFWKKNTLYEIEKLVLDEFEASFDFLRLRIGGIFISAKLQKAIETNGLKGAEIATPGSPILVFDRKNIK